MANLNYLNCNEAIIFFLNNGGQVWESVSRTLSPGVSGLLKGILGGRLD